MRRGACGADGSPLAAEEREREWGAPTPGEFSPDAQLRQRLPRLGAASLAMAMALVAFDETVFTPLATSSAGRWVGLVLLVASGGATYAAAGTVLGALRPREMLASLRRRG